MHLLCYDDSTSMVLKGRGEKGEEGGSIRAFLFAGRDKSEVSFWTFNILQGTKQSYSGLVSEVFFLFFKWGGLRGLLCVSVNCCMLLSQLLCGFA